MILLLFYFAASLKHFDYLIIWIIILYYYIVCFACDNLVNRCFWLYVYLILHKSGCCEPTIENSKTIQPLPTIDMVILVAVIHLIINQSLV